MKHFSGNGMLAAVGCAFILLLVSSSSTAGIVHVQWDSPGPTFDGSSWETAYHAVHEGLDAAVSGDEVWVAAGTYVENITLKDGVGLYGGFAGTETAREQRNWTVNVTILDGDEAGSVVTAPELATSAAVIDGFTIRNGRASLGGGINCYASSPTITNNTIIGNRSLFFGGGIDCREASPTITNNTITGNTAGQRGGAIRCHLSSPTIAGNNIIGNWSWSYGGGMVFDDCSPIVTNNTITRNRACYGGGIHCWYSHATMTSNTIMGNTASNSGGGIHCEHALPTIANNTVTGNKASDDGGAMHCWNSSPTLMNNTITGNSASDGGAIYCWNSSPTLINNTITGNSASEDGGIYCYGLSSSPMVANNILAFNSSGICNSNGSPILRHNCVYGNTDYDYSGVTDPTGTDGNISVHPRLASLEYGNVHIQPHSPCVDAGDNSAVDLSWLDMDEQPRIQGTRVDIGADESDGTVWPDDPYIIVRVSPEGDDTNDGSSWTLAKRTVQAGIDTASLAGGEVWVKAGTYYERITLHPYAYLYGGFAGTESTRGERDWRTNITILESQQNGSVVAAQAGHMCSAIDGFTVRNGRGLSGGGIYCCYSSPTIANNRITATTLEYRGGGIYCYYSSATITNNTITGNRAGFGGGICCDRSSPAITNNTITGNSAACGGGIYCYISSATITNNTITANNAPDGGGIYSSLLAPSITNNIVAFNSSGIRGYGPTIRNNCVYGNTDYNYAGPPDPTGTDGNISVDPRLASVGHGNVHIQPDSPCIDAGDDSVVQPGWVDMDGQPRIQGAHVDIGADESDGTLWPEGPYVIVRISPDGDDANDGSSWALAKQTVQAGLDAAGTEGGEIWVKAGLYYERITLHPYTYLYGGFAGSETAREERNWTVNATILDGGQGGSVVATDRGYTCSAIDGFTVRNGRSIYGGGIQCYSSCTIANNVITGNSATDGGGIWCSSCSPTITANAIVANSAASGGGIYCVHSYPTITNNTIAANNAAEGGGIRSGGSATITGNRISGNTAWYGGGIRCSGSLSTIANNTITGNDASYDGGGIFCFHSYTTIANNTITGNDASDAGGGVFCYGSPCRPTILNNIVAFNGQGIYNVHARPTLRNNCVYGNAESDYEGLSPGTGDISLDPLFADPAAGDHHLLPDSPCIDAGSNEDAPSTDMDGNPRPVDGNCDGIAVADIGAYEYQPIPVQMDVLPGDDANVIRLKGNRMIPVAILSDAVFDARNIIPVSVLFGPGCAQEVHGRGHWEDVNRDGLVDLLLHFSCGESGIDPGDESVSLCGWTVGGERVAGSDSIRVIVR